MSAYLVSHFTVDAVFAKVAELLQKAVGNHTAWTVDALWSACSSRSAFLFVDNVTEPKHAAVARFDQWGNTRVFDIVAMAGEGGGDWPESMKVLCDFAKSAGASCIVFHGRAGWAKVFPEAEVIYQTYRMGV